MDRDGSCSQSYGHRRNKRIWPPIVLMTAGLWACGGGATPVGPTKLANEAAWVDPPRRPDRTGPFKNPNVDPPEPRHGTQLAQAEIEKRLAEADRLATAGKPHRAANLLYGCANKIPPSARCEGQLAMLMLDAGTRKAHARYFLDEATALDEPQADTAFYRRLAATARRHGRYPAAASALGVILARGQATADDLLDRAHALQADTQRLPEAIEMLDKAYALAPNRHAILHEQAVLVAQVQEPTQAIPLFERYLKVAAGHEPAERIASAQARLASLRQRALKPTPAKGSAKANRPGAIP